jgi:hypothetical protein
MREAAVRTLSAERSKIPRSLRLEYLLGLELRIGRRKKELLQVDWILSSGCLFTHTVAGAEWHLMR